MKVTLVPLVIEPVKFTDSAEGKTSGIFSCNSVTISWRQIDFVTFSLVTEFPTDKAIVLCPPSSYTLSTRDSETVDTTKAIAGSMERFCGLSSVNGW